MLKTSVKSAGQKSPKLAQNNRKRTFQIGVRSGEQLSMNLILRLGQCVWLQAIAYLKSWMTES
jgi:hypothetical protein